MISRVRTRMIPASVIDCDGEFIQQALDYMTMAKKDSVRLLIANNFVVIGIDTSTTPSPIRMIDAPLALSHEASPKRGTKPSKVSKPKLPKHRKRQPFHPGLDAVNRDVILKFFDSETATASAQNIGDQLNFESVSPLRGKVSRVLAQLVSDGTLTRKGHRAQAVYTLKRKAPPKTVPLKTTVPPTLPVRTATVTASQVITEATVLAQLRKGDQMLAMSISDNLNIGRKDGPSRILVRKVLSSLLKQDVIRIVGKKNGIMPIYQLKTEEVMEV